MAVLRQMCTGSGHFSFHESLSCMGVTVMTKRVSQNGENNW